MSQDANKPDDPFLLHGPDGQRLRLMELRRMRKERQRQKQLPEEALYYIEAVDCDAGKRLRMEVDAAGLAQLVNPKPVETPRFFAAVVWEDEDLFAQLLVHSNPDGSYSLPAARMSRLADEAAGADHSLRCLLDRLGLDGAHLIEDWGVISTEAIVLPDGEAVVGSLLRGAEPFEAPAGLMWVALREEAFFGLPLEQAELLRHLCRELPTEVGIASLHQLLDQVDQDDSAEWLDED